MFMHFFAFSFLLWHVSHQPPNALFWAGFQDWYPLLFFSLVVVLKNYGVALLQYHYFLWGKVWELLYLFFFNEATWKGTQRTCNFCFRWWKTPRSCRTQHQTFGAVLRLSCRFSPGTYSWSWPTPLAEVRTSAWGIQKGSFLPDPKQASLKHLQESLFLRSFQSNYTLPRDVNSSDSIQISIHNFGNFIKKHRTSKFLRLGLPWLK